MDVMLRLLIFCWLMEPAILEVLCKKQYSQIPVRHGSAVTMPCRFTINQDLRSNTSVSWQTSNGTDDLVVAYSNIPDDEANQHRNYQGRARVQPEWPSRGHPDLLLHNVSAADHGNYTCYITFDNWLNECSHVVIHADQGKHWASLTGENIFIIILISGYVLAAIMTIIFVRCSSSSAKGLSEQKR